MGVFWQGLVVVLCPVLMGFLIVSFDGRSMDKNDKVIAEFSLSAEGMNDLEVQQFFTSRKCAVPKLTTMYVNGNATVVRSSKGIKSRYMVMVEYTPSLIVSRVMFVGNDPNAVLNR